MAVTLDLTSDSCSVLVTCSPDDAEALGGSVAGVTLEDCGDGRMAAPVGVGWKDDEPVELNDRAFDFYLNRVEIDLALAGLKWSEG